MREAYSGMPAYVNIGYGPRGRRMAMPYRAITDPSDVFVNRWPGGSPWFDNLSQRVYAPPLGGGIFSRGGLFGLGNSGDGLGSLGAVLPLDRIVNLEQALAYAEAAITASERFPATTIEQARNRNAAIEGYRRAREAIRSAIGQTASWTPESLLSATEQAVAQLQRVDALVDQAFPRPSPVPGPVPGPAPGPAPIPGPAPFQLGSLFSGPMLFVVGGLAAYLLARQGKGKARRRRR